MSNAAQNPNDMANQPPDPAKPQGRAERRTSAEPPPANHAWLSTITRPLLALGTVLMTFFMFGYFIHIANGPVQEIQGVNTAQRNSDIAQNELDNANSSLQKADAGKPDEKKKLEEGVAAKRKALDEARVALGNAKATLDISKEQRTTTKELILYILGVLSSALTTILGYYFGSSKSSTDKSNTLNEIVKTTGRAQPAKPG